MRNTAIVFVTGGSGLAPVYIIYATRLIIALSKIISSSTANYLQQHCPIQEALSIKLSITAESLRPCVHDFLQVIDGVAGGNAAVDGQ